MSGETGMAHKANAGRVHGRKADFDDYQELFATEHLHKFSPEEVGYVEPSPYKEKCIGCLHLFHNRVSGWTPCEIMSIGNNTPVAAGATCRFQTRDGKHYPLLDIL